MKRLAAKFQILDIKF